MGRSKHVSTGISGPRLTWAIRANGGGADDEMVHVSEAGRGLRCGCVCPACRSDLIAKQGKVREHHFAHAGGEECAHAVETSLHRAAKDILAKRREIVLPAVKVSFPHAPRHDIAVAPERRYSIESVETEKKIQSIIPDVIARIVGRKLLVEVKVTHGVDSGKSRKIRDLGLSCVEIDLSNAKRGLTREELGRIVVDDAEHKRWVHNLRAEKERRKRLSEATLLPAARRGLATHADGCPIPARTWRGKPYANMSDDCSGCEHAIALGFDVGVACDGFRALGKPRPPETAVPRPPPEAFEHPEEEDPMRAVGRWLAAVNLRAADKPESDG